MIYLAAPYTHPDPSIVAMRVRQAARLAASMFNHEAEPFKGLPVYAPTVHGHQLALHGATTSHSAWMKHSLDMLARADVLLVLCLPGWEESKGIMMESAFALSRGIPLWMAVPQVTRLDGAFQWEFVEASSSRASRTE